MMQEDKKIDIIITNQDYADAIDTIHAVQAPIYHALKRAFFNSNIEIEDVRLGTYNINTSDAQIGKLDKPFDSEDHQRLFNKFLKGIPFEEKRTATVFARPIQFQYNINSIVRDVHFYEPTPLSSTATSKAYTTATNTKLPVPISLLMANEIMEYMFIPIF